jgi:hypothetical protein
MRLLNSERITVFKDLMIAETISDYKRKLSETFLFSGVALN